MIFVILCQLIYRLTINPKFDIFYLVRTKDLLGLKELTADEISEILELSAEMKQLLLSGHKKSTRMAGKNVAHAFYEPSTRTAVSFDEAAKILGAVSCGMSVANSAAAKKGENLMDTGYSIVAGYPMPGVTVLGGVKVGF